MKSLPPWQSGLLWGITIPTGVVILGIAAAPFVLTRASLQPDTERAKLLARTIPLAALNFQATWGEHACPTVAQLVQDKQLDPGTSGLDPWGQPYALSCSKDEIVVSSCGPDRKLGTADDIRVPLNPSEN